MARIDNNYFTYRETPTTENGTGTLVDIKGQTLKWNQIFPTQTVNYTGTGYTLTSNNDGKFVLTVTETTSQDSSINHAWLPRTTFKSGHKYILLGSDTVHGIDVYIKGYYVYMNRIWTAPSEMGANVNFMFNSLAPGTYNLYPMIFDLTAMGLDYITSVDEFKSLFPLDYYPFNSGSLIPFMGNGIKTVGKNLIDPSIIEYGKNWSGDANATRANYSMRLPYGQYTFSIQSLGTLAEVSVSVTSEKYGERSSLGSLTNSTKRRTVTVDANHPYVQFLLRVGSGTVTQADFESCSLMLESGSTATEYEPYTSSLLNLPISTYFPSGMKDVPDYTNGGKIYDEMTSSKAITRIGSVDLGSLEWSYEETYNRFVAPSPADIKRYTNVRTQPFLCSIYTGIDDGRPLADVPNMSVYNDVNSSRLLVKNTSYTDSTIFKQAMADQNVKLYYELTTPTETAISPELDLTFNIDKGGTEELLPSSLMNGSVDLGSLTWTMYSVAQGNLFRTPNLNGIGYALQWESTNLLCAKYPTVKSSLRTDKSISVGSNNCVDIIDSSFSDATAFKQSLQGVYLWYETTDSTPTTTPILCDILYRGLIPVSVTVYPLGAGTVEGAGQYRYGETVTLVAESSDGIYRFLRYEDENGDTLSTDATYSFKAGE